MIDREKVIRGLECCLKDDCDNCPYYDPEVDHDCDYFGRCLRGDMYHDILALLKVQEPRVMTLEELEAMPYGHVLIETDKKDSLRWLDALLFSKNVNYSFDFITLEGRARLLGTEYNREWRCWTSEPTKAQREATPWN